jgi:hypothetical protein
MVCTVYFHTRTKNNMHKGKAERGLGCRATRQQEVSRQKAYVPMLMYHSSWLATYNAGTAAARLSKALHHEAVIEACYLQAVCSHY